MDHALGSPAFFSFAGAGAVAVAVAACTGDGDAATATATATSTSGTPTSTAGESEASGPETTGTTAGTTAESTTHATTPPTASETAGETHRETSGETTGETGETTGETDGDDPVDPRYEALVTYAPRVWFDGGEAYFPSTVEFAFAAMQRFADGDGAHWIESIEPLDSPSDLLPFFAGDLEGAPVYAYYADKGIVLDGDTEVDAVDLVYFFWYPYNRGKEVLNTIWGNHVGDWEHITVRLHRGPDDALTPAQVYLSSHNFGGIYAWDDLERLDTHPVVYAARGSHGLWSAPGDHVYMTIGTKDPVFDVCLTVVCADLTDITSAGIAWDTWEHVAGFDFFAAEGLGGESWPVWMSDDFQDPGEPPAQVPGGGPIYRWGNPEDCSTLGVDISDLIGVCRLENGPTGPISKKVWGPELL